MTTGIICQPTDRGPATIPSDRAWCHVCGAEVWLSKTAERRVDPSALPLQPICIRCAPGVLRAEGIDVDQIEGLRGDEAMLKARREQIRHYIEHGDED